MSQRHTVEKHPIKTPKSKKGSLYLDLNNTSIASKASNTSKNTSFSTNLLLVHARFAEVYDLYKEISGELSPKNKSEFSDDIEMIKNKLDSWKGLFVYEKEKKQFLNTKPTRRTFGENLKSKFESKIEGRVPGRSASPAISHAASDHGAKSLTSSGMTKLSPRVRCASAASHYDDLSHSNSGNSIKQNENERNNSLVNLSLELDNDNDETWLYSLPKAENSLSAVVEEEPDSSARKDIFKLSTGMQVSDDTLSLGRRASSIRTTTSKPQCLNQQQLDHNSPHTPSPHFQLKNHPHDQRQQNNISMQYTPNFLLDGKSHDDIDHEIISVTQNGIISNNLKSSPKSKIPRPPSSIANNASMSSSTSSSLNYELNTRRCVSSMGNILMMEPVTPKKKKNSNSNSSSSKRSQKSTSFSSSVTSISSRSSSESRKLRPRCRTSMSSYGN